ncbi:MAG: hypothetical protein N2Z20_03530 [Elusimicrobiales bacterium]|nr:hypothetical protein [Elusimicrobiales bacterium]
MKKSPFISTTLEISILLISLLLTFLSVLLLTIIGIEKLREYFYEKSIYKIYSKKYIKPLKDYEIITNQKYGKIIYDKKNSKSYYPHNKKQKKPEKSEFIKKTLEPEIKITTNTIWLATYSKITKEPFIYITFSQKPTQSYKIKINIKSNNIILHELTTETSDIFTVNYLNLEEEKIKTITQPQNGELTIIITDNEKNISFSTSTKIKIYPYRYLNILYPEMLSCFITYEHPIISTATQILMSNFKDILTNNMIENQLSKIIITYFSTLKITPTSYFVNISSITLPYEFLIDTQNQPNEIEKTILITTFLKNMKINTQIAIFQKEESCKLLLILEIPKIPEIYQVNIKKLINKMVISNIKKIMPIVLPEDILETQKTVKEKSYLNQLTDYAISKSNDKIQLCLYQSSSTFLNSIILGYEFYKENQQNVKIIDLDLERKKGYTPPEFIYKIENDINYTNFSKIFFSYSEIMKNKEFKKEINNLLKSIKKIKKEKL